MTKWQLFLALTDRDANAVHSVWSCRGGGRMVCGRVMAVALEDGSGSSFNVTVSPQDGGPRVTVYVRTVD